LGYEKELAEKEKQLQDTLKEKQRIAELEQREAERLEQEAEAEQDAAKKEEKKKAAELQKQKAALAKQEADCWAMHRMSCADWEAKQKADGKGENTEGNPQGTDPAGSGATPTSTGGDFQSACQQLKASWKWFKQDCERRNAWERAGDPCSDFVRGLNGCVDTDLILPTPDGDKTCQRGTVDKVKAIREACEERRKFMSYVDSTQRACSFFEKPSSGIRFDPCTDPAARPTNDHVCRDAGGGVSGQPSGGGGQPLPYHQDTRVLGGQLVFDSLRIGRPFTTCPGPTCEGPP